MSTGQPSASWRRWVLSISPLALSIFGVWVSYHMSGLGVIGDFGSLLAAAFAPPWQAVCIFIAAVICGHKATSELPHTENLPYRGLHKNLIFAGKVLGYSCIFGATLSAFFWFKDTEVGQQLGSGVVGLVVIVGTYLGIYIMWMFSDNVVTIVRGKAAEMERNPARGETTPPENPLASCSYCHKTVSPRAEKCPHCGEPNST